MAIHKITTDTVEMQSNPMSMSMSMSVPRCMFESVPSSTENPYQGQMLVFLSGNDGDNPMSRSMMFMPMPAEDQRTNTVMLSRNDSNNPMGRTIMMARPDDRFFW